MEESFPLHYQIDDSLWAIGSDLRTCEEDVEKALSGQLRGQISVLVAAVLAAGIAGATLVLQSQELVLIHSRQGALIKHYRGPCNCRCGSCNRRCAPCRRN